MAFFKPLAQPMLEIPLLLLGYCSAGYFLKEVMQAWQLSLTIAIGVLNQPAKLTERQICFVEVILEIVGYSHCIRMILAQQVDALGQSIGLAINHNQR